MGPLLADGSCVIVAGSANDYSVTQSGCGTPFDVYHRYADTDPGAASIQCPLGDTSSCTFASGGAATPLLSGYALLPGVLHAYTANITGFVAAVPTPASLPLVLMALGLMGFNARRASRVSTPAG